MRSPTVALAALATAALAAFSFHSDCVVAPGWDREAPPAMRAEGAERALWLVWRRDADRASAALLLQAVRRHPRCERLRCRLALCRAERGLCEVLDASSSVRAFTAGFQPLSQLSCDGRRRVSAVGRRLAPLEPRALAALSAAAAARPACLAADRPAFYESEAELRACGFEPGAPLAPAAPRSPADLPADRSFRFLDAELWADQPRVLTVRDDRAEPALLVAEDAPMLMHAPWLLEMLRAHAPEPRALRELRAREAAVAGGGAERGSAALAAAAAAPAGDVATAPERSTLLYRALVYVCDEDDWGPAGSPAEMLRRLARPLAARTRPHRVEVRLECESVACSSSSELGRALAARQAGAGAHRLLGAVAAGAGAATAARQASSRGLAVVTYDAQTGEGEGAALSAGARAAELAEALGAAMHGCGWGRAALLSAADEPARLVAARLRAPGPLRRASLAADEAGLRATLRSLSAERTRAVVLNSDGAGAARALRLAAEEGLAECAWLAREWTAGAPPLPLLALRSAPRSAAEAGAAGGAGDAAAALEAAWPGARWPARAAPLAEALLTLTVGFARLFTAHEELRYDHVAADTLPSLRKNLRNDPIPLPGVARNLTFDERGARPPPPLLELWRAGATAGRALAAADLPAACPAVPAAPVCSLPAGGDEYAPAICLDLAAAVGAPAALLAALLAGLAAAALRRRRAARARARLLRLRAEAGAALLARQPLAGAELRALLVERERVTLLRALGAGRHGRVWLARLAPAGAPLAAKGPLAGAAPAEEGELLREAAALAPLRHAHVLRLLGVCVGPGPPLLLTALATHGDLLRYLRARRPPAGGADEAAHVAAPALTRLAREAALALAYLATRGLVHRDVRAANCLLDERRALKLADFGMARRLRGEVGGEARGEVAGDHYACRRRALFPVLWMAPESLARGVFSCASDVWALGVLALELVSLGARPFGELAAAEAVALVARGGHARLPAGASADTRRLARLCWRREARARPSAATLAAWLEARPAALAPCPAAPDADSGLEETDAS